MNNLYHYFSSIQELFDSFLWGNEIVFRFEATKYFILPKFENGKVIGVSFGEAYTDKEVLCKSADELGEVHIQQYTFKEILDRIDILEINYW